MESQQIFFILVEPLYRGNVGAAARVMNNFGFDRLRIVGSTPQKEDFYLAVHSETLLRNVETFDSLAEALSDIDLSIAVSRRKGRKKNVDFNADEITGYIGTLPRGNTAFVFGRETYGLKDEEADLCPIRCTIPTHPRFPSLNLAQAVAVIAYHLYNDSLSIDGQAGTLAGFSEVSAVCRSIVNHLKQINYFKDGDPLNAEKQLKNLLVKSYSTKANLRFLEKMFHRIAVLTKYGSNKTETG